MLLNLINFVSDVM